MRKKLSGHELSAAEKFWSRFEESMTLWFPELAGPREWAVKLKASEHDIYNWKKRRPDRPPTRPQRKIPQLAEMYEAGGLRERGGDPWALAKHVYGGEGKMPRPAGGSIVPNVSAPSRPGVSDERADISQRTPKDGILAAEVLSAQAHGKKLDARVALPLIEDALESGATEAKMRSTLRALRELLTGGLVAFASLHGDPAIAPRTSSCEATSSICRKPDFRQLLKRKARATKRIQRSKRPQPVRTSRRKALKPNLTHRSSTPLTAISQNRTRRKGAA